MQVESYVKPGISRIVGIVLGVLMVVGGISCFAEPVRAYGAFGWIASVALLADGIGKLLLYFDAKRAGFKDIYVLINGIISVAFAVLLLANQAALAAAELTLAYAVGVWALATGIVRIVRSFRLRNVQEVLDVHRIGSNWDIALISGLALVVVGLVGIANPLLGILAIVWEVGAVLIVAGASLVTATA